MAELEGKIRSWRESTTTPPSGLHLSHHYKALFASHQYSSTQETTHITNTIEFETQKERSDKMQDNLGHLHLNLMNYALKRGYSYKRWQTMANTILLKDPDNVREHRTRVIHIYKADFNLILGIKWRKATHTAETNKWLNSGQFGSRKWKSAINPVLVEELPYKISKATQRSVLLTNYDAASCFNRIIPN
jgi:hypothetical protein